MFAFEAISFMASKRSENGKGPLASMLRQQRSRSFLLRCMSPVVGTFLPFVALQHHGSYRGYRRHVADGAGRPSLTRSRNGPNVGHVGSLAHQDPLLEC